MRKVFTIFFLSLLSLSVFAQDLIIGPLSTNPEVVRQFENGEISLPGTKDNIILHLPFIDDFSKNHLFGSDIQYWDDNFVFVNPTYGVNPPTIGVATFDGLSFDGYPYNFSNPNADGIADYLTSCKINLDEDESGVPYQLSDSILLSFYYQPQGMGFAPRNQDSLVLEFYDPYSEVWVRMWGVSGTEIIDFELVYVAVEDSRFLHEEFRFRFRNRGRLSGNLDHWHIDMVWFDKDRTSGIEIFEDVGYQYPVNNMLNNYTSIPYKHYKTTSSIHMNDEVDVDLINNHNVAVNLSNVKMINYSQGSIVNESAIPGVSNFPGQSVRTENIPMDNYVFNPNIDEPFVSFENKFVLASGAFDLVPDNDTISFTQYFENYYAYDDGSAEAGIGLTEQGYMAVRYDALQADSIIGMKIYFNPIYQQPIYHFSMYLWEEEGGKPGNVIYVDPEIHYPEFISEGHDVFGYYFFDSAVYVSGTYFAGVWQSPSTIEGVYSLNVGFDYNTDNIEKNFYKTAFNWLDFPASGSLMIRPVFQSEMDDAIMGISSIAAPKLTVYPNPANSQITIKSSTDDELKIVLLTIDGRSLIKGSFKSEIRIDISDYPSGLYLLKAIDNKGVSSVQKILVSH